MTHRFVLGISGLYHDSAAAVLRDGEVVAAVHEERLSRIRHDPSFPVRAIRSCIEQAGVPEDGLVAVALYEKPLTAAVRADALWGEVPQCSPPALPGCPTLVGRRLPVPLRSVTMTSASGWHRICSL